MAKKIIKKAKTRVEKSAPPALDKATLLKFINSKNGMVTKREIAHEFGIRGEERRILNMLLRELDEEGTLSVQKRKQISSLDAPPKSGIFQAVSIDEHGELWAKQVGEDGPVGPKFLVHIPARREKGETAVGINERFVGLANKSDNPENGPFIIRIIKRLGAAQPKIFGVLHIETGEQVAKIIPSDRKTKFEIMVLPQHMGDAKNGDLVAIRLLPNRGLGVRKGEVSEVYGNVNDPKSASILAIAAHNIPTGFSEEEEQEAENALPVTLDYRKDLRDIPFVTIDPEDARDHDDAVFAKPTANGHEIWVAIADVAHYVKHGSALDKGALHRGNSVYFPDRVVPMLPFRLSADLCSLMEDVDRPCLAVKINVDNHGHLKHFEFVRGLMRSFASLTYSQAQWAIDGKGDEKTNVFLEPVLKPLWAAYEALKHERASREPLDIESTERKIVLGANGKVESITTKERFDAHKLIEEFMILANVCAATAIENKQSHVIYRVHDRPSESKIASLGEFLATLNIKWTKGETVTPKRFNRTLAIARGGDHLLTVNEMILRSQAQAIYDVDNIGHFGLQLHKYAHFTSPIRRYADLTVHRTLIEVLGLGGNTYEGRVPQKQELQRIAQAISDCERRAMAAERDATDRYLAAYLSDRVGAVFDGRITSVTHFGVFVRLDETMGDGLVPVSHLGDEYFFHDEGAASLIGQYSGDTWQLGMRVKVRLLEATPISGGLMFDMVSDAKKGPVPKGKSAGRNGRDFGRARPSRVPKNIKRGKKR